MRILHTSDLHLGGLWRGVSRRTDQERVLAEILGLCEQHDVDMLLISGDLFADRVEVSHAQVARRFLEQVRGYLQRGRAVFLLRGNHDPFDLFQLMRLLVAEMAGHGSWPLVVADLPGVYSVPGHQLQVVALPYLSPRWLAQSIEGDLSPEEQLAGLAGRLSHLAEALYRKVSSGAPAIFTSHLLLHGAHLREDLEFEAGYSRELWLEPSRLPQFTSYNAMGHIHLSQEVRGTGKPTWYSGAPDRFDLGEREYQPHVLLVTTPDSPGGAATVEPLPISSATPFVLEQLEGLNAVGRFCSTTVGISPLGEVTVAGVPPASRSALESQLHGVAPRVQVRWALDPELQVPDSDPVADPHDVHATVLDYLERAFAQQPERRARLEAAFESLWSEPGEVKG